MGGANDRVGRGSAAAGSRWELCWTSRIESVCEFHSPFRRPTAAAMAGSSITRRRIFVSAGGFPRFGPSEPPREQPVGARRGLPKRLPGSPRLRLVADRGPATSAAGGFLKSLSKWTLSHAGGRCGPPAADGLAKPLIAFDVLRLGDSMATSRGVKSAHKAASRGKVENTFEPILAP